MKKLLLIGLTLVTTLSAQPTKQWSHGNPSSEEQFALEVINRVRRDPVAAVNFFIGQENAKPVLKAAIANNTFRPDGSPPLSPEDSLRAAMKVQLDGYNNSSSAGRTPAPKAPLAFYPLFNEQARTQNLATGGATTFPAFDAADFFNTGGANVPTKVTPPKVVQQFGFNGIAAPTISGTNATGGTASLKPGFAPGGGPQNFSRGQLLFVANYYDPLVTLREAFVSGTANLAMYLDESFVSNTDNSGVVTLRGKARMIGISLGSARTSAPGVGARVLSAFATDNEAFQTSDLPFGSDTIFIVGVVYQDNDKDGAYSPGEGLAGVRITPNKGEWFAVTSESGGFAIPVSKNIGALTLAATGGPQGSTLDTTSVVTVQGDSVKVDFVRQNSAKPAQVTVEETTGVNQIVNMSTRGISEPGENAIIGGFVVRGDASVKKTLVIRGVSQTLALPPFGVEGVLRKPLLTLYKESVPIATARTQDTYTPAGQVKPVLADASASVGAFPLSPSNFAGQPDGIRLAGDTMLIWDVEPGLYSVAVTPDVDTPSPGFDVPSGTGIPSNSGSSGIILLEIYDRTPDKGTLINISTRGKVESGARQMFVGFVIRGDGFRQILIRGIGPGLTAFGLNNAIGDSNVGLYDGDSKQMLFNDDWGLAPWTDQTAVVSPAVGAFGLNADSKDGVILARVAPGRYSAIIGSSQGEVGRIGLAEFYAH